MMNKLTFKKCVLFASIFAVAIATVGGTTTLVQAQTETEEESATASAETAEQLRNRINRIVEERREEIDSTVSLLEAQKRGFVGEVDRISENAITVNSLDTTEIVAIGEGTTLLKDGDSLPIDEVAVGNWLVVMGIINDEDVFTPRRVIVSEETLRPRPKAVNVGTLTTFDILDETLSIEPRASQEEVTYTLSDTADYIDINNEVIEDTDLISDAFQALVVGYIDDDDDETRIATTVQILSTNAALEEAALAAEDEE